MKLNLRGLLIGAVALSCAMPMAADTSLTFEATFDKNFYGIVWFPKSGDELVYTCSYGNYNEPRCFHFYNKDFEPVADFEEPQGFCDEMYRYLDVDKGTNYEVEDDIEFTQTLFNDDADIEYMVITGNRLDVRQVMSGNTIASVNLASGVERYDIERLIKIGGKMYISVTAEDADYNYHYYLYRIDGGASGTALTMVKSEKVTCSPNPVTRGEKFNVKCSNEKGVNVMLTDMNGGVAGVHSFKAGDAVAVPTDGLTPGMYIYTVVSGKGRPESGKLIVK